MDIKDIRVEDILEFIYEAMDTWKKFADSTKKDKEPITFEEKMKEDLRSMIQTIKEEKFEEMDNYFGIIT